MNNRLISVIAHSFSNVLKEWLTPEEMRVIIDRNSIIEYNDLLCATHDFCDANIAMNTAFNRVLGRDAQTNNDNDLSVWNSAWKYAKKNAFFSDS